MQQLTKLNVASRTATADIGQATMPLAAFREIELGTLEIGLGTLKTAPAAQSFGRGLADTSMVADAADKALDRRNPKALPTLCVGTRQRVNGLAVQNTRSIRSYILSTR